MCELSPEVTFAAVVAYVLYSNLRISWPHANPTRQKAFSKLAYASSRYVQAKTAARLTR